MLPRSAFLLNCNALLVIALLSVSVPGLATDPGFVDKTPTFHLADAAGWPGGTAAVRLYVYNGVSDTRALNFTVRVTQGETLINGSLSGSSELPGYEENSPKQGEYRAIIDPLTNFSTEGETLPAKPLATIFVPIKSDATAGTQIKLKLLTEFDEFGVVGLTGMSDSSGLSVHGSSEVASPAPGDPRAIVGNTATITVLGSTTIDFCPLNVLPAEWEFAQVIPFNTPVRLTPSSVPGQGFSVTLQAANTFGFLQTKDTDATIIPSPGNGKVLHVLWTIGSNQASAYNLPTFRLRASARDASFTQEHIFQEATHENKPPVIMPVNTDLGPRNFESVYYCPASLTNNYPTVASNGIILAFDVLQFGDNTNGAENSRLDLKKIVYSAFDPDGLGAKTNVLDLDFSDGDSHNFTPLNFHTTTTPADTCQYDGILPSELRDDLGGLSIEPSDPPNGISPCPNSPSKLNFSMGIWEKTFNQASGEHWEVAADTLYKVEFTLASDAPALNPSHTARLRFTVGEQGSIANEYATEFTSTAIVNAIQDTSFDPRGGGKLYTAFVKFPPTTVGLPVKVSYDVYWANETTGGKITLKDLKVWAYNLTSAAQFGSACPTTSP